MTYYEVWDGDLYLGIFDWYEARFLDEQGYTIIALEQP